MNVAALHSRTVKQSDFRILGVRLLPLKVGHLRHLESEDCDPVRTPADLGTAIRICSMPPARWAAWSRSPLTILRLFIWGRRLGAWDFADKVSLWADYVRWHTELPLFTAKGQAADSVLPSYRFTRVRLLRLGYSAAEVDDVPYLDAMWDLMTAAALDGRGEAKDGNEEDLEREIHSTDIEAIKLAAAEELRRELLKGN